MTICYLREGQDCLEDARRMPSIAYAKAEFMAGAEELAAYGQVHEAAIHIAKSMAEVVEYPDYVLALGPKGGLVFHRC